MKKIMGVILSSLMLLNPSFNVTYATNTETKNVNHSSKETRNKILKYGALAVGCLAAIGIAYTGYNYFSNEKRPVIFDFDSKSIDFNSRNQKIKQMISKYQKSGKEFVVITQIEESRYIIEYFGFSGNILNVMEVSESELNYLLDGLYEVIPRKSGSYPGTKEFFNKIFDFDLRRLKKNPLPNDLPPSKLPEIVAKPEKNEEQYELTLHREHASDCYTLTAVFYDNDEALKKFTNEALEYKYSDVPLVNKKGFTGFSEKIPNSLKEYGMNTCYSYRNGNIITKLVPINSKKLKDMSPPEYEKVQKLLEICMSGIIVFDYSDSELDEICKDVCTEDCEKILKRNVTMNYVFRLIRSVSWGNFLGCYTYNKSKMTNEQVDDRCNKLQQYMGRLERLFGVDNRWNTRNQSSSAGGAFRSITNVPYFDVGKDLYEREPLVIEYIRKNCKVNIVD